MSIQHLRPLTVCLSDAFQPIHKRYYIIFVRCLLGHVTNDADQNLHLAQELLRGIYVRLIDNKFVLSIDKTKLIAFHARQSNVEKQSLMLNGHFLSTSEEPKIFWVTIHENLYWKGHCDSLAGRIPSKTYLLRSLRSYVSVGTLVLGRYL